MVSTIVANISENLGKVNDLGPLWMIGLKILLDSWVGPVQPVI